MTDQGFGGERGRVGGLTIKSHKMDWTEIGIELLGFGASF